MNRRKLFKVGGTAGLLAAAARLPRANLIAAQGGAEYDIIDLGPLREDDDDESVMSLWGEISGITDDGMAFGAIGVSAVRRSPAIWSVDGKARKLKSGTFGGIVRGLNSEGIAVGQNYPSEDENGSQVSNAVRWIDGEMEVLPVGDELVADNGEAVAINDDGVIAGNLGSAEFGGDVGVRWVDNEVQRLAGVPREGQPEQTGNVDDMNQAGTVLGRASVVIDLGGGSSTGRRRPVLWKGTEVTLLDLPPDTDDLFDLQEAHGLNEREQFVAVYNRRSHTYSYLYTDGQGEELVGTSVFLTAFALDLNDDGVAVGTMFGAVHGHAALWRDGETVDLNDLIAPDAGLTLTLARAINNEGAVAGLGVGDDDSSHGVILIPTSS